MVSWAFCDAMFWGTKIQIASKDVSTLRSSMFISFSRKYTHTYQETETFRMITLTSMSSECNVSQAIIVPVQNKLRAPLLADHHRRRELCQRLLERLFDVRGALSNTQRKGGDKINSTMEINMYHTNSLGGEIHFTALGDCWVRCTSAGFRCKAKCVGGIGSLSFNDVWGSVQRGWKCVMLFWHAIVLVQGGVPKKQPSMLGQSGWLEKTKLLGGWGLVFSRPHNLVAVWGGSGQLAVVPGWCRKMAKQIPNPAELGGFQPEIQVMHQKT